MVKVFFILQNNLRPSGRSPSCVLRGLVYVGNYPQGGFVLPCMYKVILTSGVLSNGAVRSVGFGRQTTTTTTTTTASNTLTTACAGHSSGTMPRKVSFLLGMYVYKGISTYEYYPMVGMFVRLCGIWPANLMMSFTCMEVVTAAAVVVAVTTTTTTRDEREYLFHSHSLPFPLVIPIHSRSHSGTASSISIRQQMTSKLINAHN